MRVREPCAHVQHHVRSYSVCVLVLDLQDDSGAPAAKTASPGIRTLQCSSLRSIFYENKL
eukprot:6205296-Pleurochrysis_carterae.AAC.2